jgi:hypothetical protein
VSSKFEDLFGRRLPLLLAELVLIIVLGWLGSTATTAEIGAAMLTGMATVIGIFGLTAKDYFSDVADEKAAMVPK